MERDKDERLTSGSTLAAKASRDECSKWCECMRCDERRFQCQITLEKGSNHSSQLFKIVYSNGEVRWTIKGPSALDPLYAGPILGYFCDESEARAVFAKLYEFHQSNCQCRRCHKMRKM